MSANTHMADRWRAWSEDGAAVRASHRADVERITRDSVHILLDLLGRDGALAAIADELIGVEGIRRTPEGLNAISALRWLVGSYDPITLAALVVEAAGR
jgi:hypothetical protein